MVMLKGSPGGLVVKNPLANAENTSSLPIPEVSRMLWGNLVSVLQLLHPCSATREATAVISPCTTMKINSQLTTATEKAHAQQ